MIEFNFNVKLSYREAQAFIDEELEKAHDRLTARVFAALAKEFYGPNVIVEVEPV